MKRIFLATIILVSSFLGSKVLGQTVLDAFRMTDYTYGATARSAAVGGAFGSLGGDIGSMSINPASLGDFWKPEISFTLGLNNTNTGSFLRNSNSTGINSASATNLSLESVGIVFTGEGNNVFRNFNMAFTLNRLNTFKSTIQYSGASEGSITERFAERGNSLTIEQLDNFEAGLAWDEGAIFDFDNDNFYQTDFIETDTPTKSELINRSGGITELNFGMGTNIANKINVGISINVPFVEFESNREYRESDPNDDIPFFQTLSFVDNLKTTGSGANAKIGISGKLGKHLRLSGAYHTPTSYVLTDEFDTSLDYRYIDGTVSDDGEPSLSPFGSFRYGFKSPMRLHLGAAGLFSLSNIRGFISYDAEFVNFANASFNLDRFIDDPAEAAFEAFLNDGIDSDLQSTVNHRFGFELGVPAWRVRGGYAMNANPFVNNTEDQFRTQLNFGLGFRRDNFFIDFSMRFMEGNQNYSPYVLTTTEREQVVDVNTTRTTSMLTLGFKI